MSVMFSDEVFQKLLTAEARIRELEEQLVEADLKVAQRDERIAKAKAILEQIPVLWETKTGEKIQQALEALEGK